MKLKNKMGALVIVSGPSGSGKGTIMNEYFKNYENDNSFLSISATTRSPRAGEKEGVNYYYKTKEEFEFMINNDGLAEWAEFCGNYYGTPKKAVLDMLEAGKNVILEIEVQGAMQVKESFPEAACVFVLPPSFTELRRRLVERKTESEEVIDIRLKRAKQEVLLIDNYDYILINDDLNIAVEKFHSIVVAESQKISRNKNIINEVCELC